ncbi:MAG: ATP-grasp domain-containing protein [Caldisericia bacterium]
MNLTETDARKIFKSVNIPVFDGYLVDSLKDAKVVADRIADTLVVKIESGTGSRGKAGGVKICEPRDIEPVARDLFSKTIGGNPVKKIMIAKAVDMKSGNFIYLSYWIPKLPNL